jgi:hypothetical protein
MFDRSKFTVSDFEGHLSVSRRAADGLLSYVKEIGGVEDTGETRKAEGAKGKGATLYRVTDKLPNPLQYLFADGEPIR